MKPEQRGRTALWGKVLSAALLALLGALVAPFVIAEARTADRESAAFDRTRADARRFADTVLADTDGRPSREEVLRSLSSATGNMRGNGTLHTMTSTEGGTRVEAQFSHLYIRAHTLFGSTEAMAHRCFTFDFPLKAQESAQVRITAHGADESCVDVGDGRPHQADPSRSER